MVNTTIIFVDAFDPRKSSQLAQVMLITVVFSALLITFTVVGGILIHRLGAFFKHNYDRQRFALFKALILISLSLLILTIRYALEYSYLENNIPLYQPVSEGPSKKSFPLYTLILFLIVSDFGPILAQIYCMWLAKQGNWNELMSRFLEPPFQDEQSVVLRSHILDDLKNEIDMQRFHSKLLDESEDSDQNQTARKSVDAREAAFTEVLGTSYMLRGSFDIRAELKACDDADQLKRSGSAWSQSSIALTLPNAN